MIPGTCLSIVDFSSSVYLGTTAQEKAHSQTVIINVEIHFNHIIQAQMSDDLNHTIDYVSICDLIDRVCKSKKFNLIENLTYEICQTLIKEFREKYKGTVSVAVIKTEVPVPGLKGVKWTCKDILS